MVFSFKNLIIPSSVLSPSKSIGAFLEFAGKNLIVGNPLILIPVISLAVASHLAITMFGLCLSYSAAASHLGANYLQCPHHGA